MSRHRSTPARICALLLLVLAVSPLTAPFSTCDLFDLLTGRASSAGAIVQAKAADDALPRASGPVGPPAQQPCASSVRAHAPGRAARLSVLDSPLRI
jgi:hypothetical protein